MPKVRTTPVGSARKGPTWEGNRGERGERATAQPPAIVVGTEVTALGMIRSLARARIPSYVLAPPGDIALRSRWAQPMSGVGDADGPLAERLGASDLERAVLLPGSDSAVREIAALPPELAHRFPASVPSSAALEVLIDKGTFAAFMQEAGLPHPRTLELKEEGELDRVDSGFFERAFLKPRDSQRFFRRFGVKAVPVRSRSEALRELGRLREEGFSMVLQEYIPGPPTGHVFLDGFVDRRGALSHLLTRRRTRMHPRDFGNSTLCETVPPAEVGSAVDALRRLLDTLSYRGIFSAEVKFDPRTGEYRFLEVNARAWWYVEFASRCGVNVCEAAYLDALDRPVEPVGSYPAGVRLLYPRHDFEAFRVQREHANGDAPSAWSWFRPWLGAHQALFASDDPWPALWDAQTRVIRRIRKRAAGRR